jgi:hypothetical protein
MYALRRTSQPLRIIASSSVAMVFEILKLML